MPTKNKKIKKRQNKVKIAVYGILGIAVLALLVVYGVHEIKKSVEIKEQRSTLESTLSDIESLYSKFAADTKDYSLEDEEKPRNECSEISAVYVKTYTCGTRAEISYLNTDEALFKKLNEILRNNIDTSVFRIDEEQAVRESSLYNGQNMFIALSHLKSGQTCYINGSYHRELETYNKHAKVTSYSFNCNLNSSYLTYPPKD